MRYRLTEPAQQVTRALLQAAGSFHHSRPPELYAGVSRDPGAFPVPYPDANVPQAWASGAMIQLLTALAGLEPDAVRRRIQVRPAVPEWLGTVELCGLRLGDARLDLRLRGDTAEATRKSAPIEVASEPPPRQ
jgi:glycogen debranching enzyme